MTDLIRNRAWIDEYEAVDDGEDYDEDALSFGDEDEDYEILKILKMVNVRIASRLLLSMIFKTSKHALHYRWFENAWTAYVQEHTTHGCVLS
jgi:predicted DNA binding CopG/RHH family protein